MHQRFHKAVDAYDAAFLRGGLGVPGTGTTPSPTGLTGATP